MTTKTTPPPIERLKFRSLIIDNRYSGRTEAEINANAKDRQKELASAGGWSPAMPGHYFVGEDGKKYLSAGFSRVKGSQLNGWDEGYFVQVGSDPVDLLLACITTNSTRTLSALQQGQRFEELSNGIVADDFQGALADPENPNDWKIQPMSNAAIAEKIGKSSEWVRKCRSVYTAPAPIASMIEADEIAVTVFEGAKSLADKHHEGSESKMEKMCRRALAFAKEEGKDKATEKHFNAIKGEFIPEKKLIAVDPSAPPEKPKADKPVKSDEEKEREADDHQKDFIEKENLFSQIPPTPDQPTKKQVGDRKKMLATVLTECSDEYMWSASDTDIDGAVDKIIAALDVF